ncbi:zinc finger protein ZFPM2b [Trichomycterus rosablanca]|uniref:zinc finger protein ZFPM2b n=1 Tax=Trichomycterus rosablanca TaxID=2290929 RepID=UPI002F34F1F3
MSRRKQSNPRQFRRSIHRSAAGHEGENQDEQKEVGKVEDRHQRGSEELDSSNDIFPCRMCGIWFRSEKNLQVHLLYYCSGLPTNRDLQTSSGSAYPECNTSLLGPRGLEMYLSMNSAFRVEEPSSGSGLKCTICDYTADTLLVLQPHLLSHLVPHGPRNLSKHQKLHRHGGPGTKVHIKENELELSKSSGTGSLKQDREDSDILDSPVCHAVVQEDGGREERTVKGEANSENQRVKSEPSSPHVASSPIPDQTASPFQMPPSIPQGINMVPQASEVLAKMSKLVHRRLRNGGNGFPPLIFVSKGASCFECNVTFSNDDNYLVHKKHYCNGPWQHVDESAGLRSGLNAGIPNLTPFTTSPVDPFKASAKKPKGFPALVKKLVDSPGVEERPKYMTVESKMSSETSENEADPSQTTCQACKITFGRQENYVVHKRYYCASRHDPPPKRATTRTSGIQKPGQARKRRKMGSPDPTAQSVAPNSLESLKYPFCQQYNTIHGLVSKHRETSLMVLASRKSKTEQEDVDAPMDLSKKCSMQSGNLMDYHKCSVCKISFYKVEDYLSHKLNFCPLDHKARGTTIEGSGNVKNTDIHSADIGTSTDEQPFLRDDGHPWKKIRPDDQIWPYYEISPADHASEVSVMQSPKEASEGENDQPMPNLKVDDKQEQGSSPPNINLSSLTPDLRRSTCSSPTSKTEEIPGSKRSTSVSNFSYCSRATVQ